ncbi:hypothetical protein AB6C72_23965, partial [Vibrio splendidus]
FLQRTLTSLVHTHAGRTQALQGDSQYMAFLIQIGLVFTVQCSQFGFVAHNLSERYAYKRKYG